LGRFHEQNDRGLLMRDVAVHEVGAGDLEIWLEKQRKFGVAATHRTFRLASEEVVEIRRFSPP